jgi:endonuclease/exonuclease/phosphatase family metal-dependent hydrolase
VVRTFLALATVVSLSAGVLGACGGDGGNAASPHPTDGDAAAESGRDAAGDPALDAAMPIDAADASASPKILRIMTFNIKHGEIGGLDGIADTIKGEAPDLVGLQEVDVGAGRSASVDEPHRLGQLTGMTNLFRTAFAFPDGGSYGVALLSRFPLLASERLALTSSGEQRILAVIDVELAKGRVIEVGVTHMDLQAAARATQAQEIVAKLGGKPLAILMGDFNAQPDEAAVKTFSGAFLDSWAAIGTGPGFTIPPGAPTRRIDYIMLAKDWPKPTAAHVPVSTASDHLPLVVDVPLPP